jgi:VanZ family protein
MTGREREWSGGLVRRRLPWVLPIAWMVCMTWLSSQPDTSLPDFWRFPHHDKVEHLSTYVVLGALLCWAFGASGVSPRGALSLAILAGTLFAASDEVHQRFVVTRHCEFTDWVADVIGLVIGSALVCGLRRGAIRQRREARDDLER